MSKFKEEEILGLRIDEQCVCRACLSSDEVANWIQDQIITEIDLKDDEFQFCDRCSREIKVL